MSSETGSTPEPPSEPLQYDDAYGQEIGVGPHPLPWPEGERYDPELLALGDRRNVGDAYRDWMREAIVADLDLRRHDFHVAVENWGHDFNIGSVVRTANAFLAKEIHIVLTALEPARRHGHRPLPACAPPPGHGGPDRVGGGRGAADHRDRQPPRRRTAGADRAAAPVCAAVRAGRA
ncbi:hypothetical protein SMICM304S_01845 [Streptomyces microflavus]